MSVSKWDPTQVSFRKWNHTDLSYFIFSVFGQQSGISDGELSLCCISTELILLAWLSFKAHERISKTNLQWGKVKKVTSWLPFAHVEAHVQYQPPCCFVWTRIPQFHPQISKSGSVRLGNSSDTLIPWDQLPAPTQMPTLKAGTEAGVVHLSSTSCPRDLIICRKYQSCNNT